MAIFPSDNVTALMGQLACYCAKCGACSFFSVKSCLCALIEARKCVFVSFFPLSFSVEAPFFLHALTLGPSERL